MKDDGGGNGEDQSLMASNGASLQERALIDAVDRIWFELSRSAVFWWAGIQLGEVHEEQVTCR